MEVRTREKDPIRTGRELYRQCTIANFRWRFSRTGPRLLTDVSIWTVLVLASARHCRGFIRASIFYWRSNFRRVNNQCYPFQELEAEQNI